MNLIIFLLINLIRGKMQSNKANKVQLEGQKLMYHVHEVSAWLKGDTVAPIYIEIGPINSCNHRCSFCALDYLKSKGSAIDKDVLIRTLKNMSEFGVKSIMFAGEGEPFLYGPLAEVIEKAKGFGLDIAITTNGALFDEKKINAILKNLSWIKFSIDAGKKETYAKIHGCKEEDFLKVISNIKLACEYRSKNNSDCAIGCQMLLIPTNISEVEDLIIHIKNTGADYLVLKPYSQHPNSVNKLSLDLKKEDEHLSNLASKHSTDSFKVIYRKSSASEIYEKGIEYDICYGINFFALIDALGNIIPCNIFYEKEEYYYGNIYKNTFKEIWSGEQRKAVVAKLYKQGCKECRKGCRMNFVNKYLHALKNRDVEHINFI